MTPEQRNALHLYYERLAEALNDAGYDMKSVFQVKEIEVPWNKYLVKEALWRNLQKTMLNKESTNEMTNSEVSKVYEVLDRHISSNFGVHVPFPSRHEQK